MADKHLEAAAKLADTSKLTEIDGKPVTRTTVAVTNAGDGLSQAMKIEPTELHHGDTVFIALECEVSKVSFTPVDPQDLAGAQIRTHTLRAGAATIVDGDLVQKYINEQKETIAKAKEKAAGVERMFEGDKGDDPIPTPSKGTAKKAAAKKAPAAKKAAPAKAAAKKAAGKPKATKAEEGATVTSIADRAAAAAESDGDIPKPPVPEWD